MSNDPAPRILISRMSSLGDTVLTMPIACALREEFPNAHLAWVVEKESASIIREHSALDEVIQLDSGWSKSIKAMRETARILRTRAFDVLIDCEGTSRTALLGWLAAVPQRIGFSGPHSSLLNRILNTEQVTPVFDHLTDRALELLIPMGIHSPRVRWHLPIPSTARAWARTWRRNIPNPKIAILDPGAPQTPKLWDAANFARVLRHLHDVYHYRCIICWDTQSERDFANEIVEHSRGSASLTPHTDLQHLAALLELSDLFLSGDIEPLHVSVAVGTPTINLHTTSTARTCSTYRQLTLQSGKVRRDKSQRNRDPKSNHHSTARCDITFERVCDAVAEIESKQRLLRSA